jgi:hypothetical protein
VSCFSPERSVLLYIHESLIYAMASYVLNIDRTTSRIPVPFMRGGGCRGNCNHKGETIL